MTGVAHADPGAWDVPRHAGDSTNPHVASAVADRSNGARRYTTHPAAAGYCCCCCFCLRSGRSAPMPGSKGTPPSAAPMTQPRAPHFAPLCAGVVCALRVFCCWLHLHAPSPQIEGVPQAARAESPFREGASQKQASRARALALRRSMPRPRSPSPLLLLLPQQPASGIEAKPPLLLLMLPPSDATTDATTRAHTATPPEGWEDPEYQEAVPRRLPCLGTSGTWHVSAHTVCTTKPPGEDARLSWRSGR
ncbi:hypothetical protein HPB50_000885 [Hyalomma asiaticum]|uniref:Uncharacterized protein n=1 Tax=Hyalomma asiaticum TaxID=266040 RepID=A0ACB7SB84_HYAAI|nr:hypothetical protein HPB50_000885 [Hyalomma asiaticum]